MLDDNYGDHNGGGEGPGDHHAKSIELGRSVVRENAKFAPILASNNGQRICMECLLRSMAFEALDQLWRLHTTGADATTAEADRILAMEINNIHKLLKEHGNSW